MRIDLTGRRFGRLRVLNPAGHAKNGNALWLCQCDCGNSTVADSYRLRHGMTRSCGCLRQESSRKSSQHNAAFLQQQHNHGKYLFNEDGVPLCSIKMGKRNTSGHIGVHFNRQSNQWFARLMVNGHYVLLKAFSTYEDAVAAREAAEEQYLRPRQIEVG